MRDNWKTVKLEAVADVNKQSIGKDYPYDNIQYLDTGSVTQGKLMDFRNFLYQKHQAEQND